ncbi:MAG: hypothetical protein RL662_763 [Bacteroidota bacterium]|jgi:hypothetical protein
MDLQNEVQLLIKEIEKTHRYSMSRIYNLHNKIFNKNELPQSCASCLIKKVKDLKNWLSTENADAVSNTEVVTKLKTGSKKKQKNASTKKEFL